MPCLKTPRHKRPPPPDWVYVNNFATPHRPVAIALPSGRAPALDNALDRLIDDLKVALPAAFESEDYQKRRAAIEQERRGQNERAFTTVREKATAKGIAILRTPMGFAMAPMKDDGQVVPPAEFNAWPRSASRRRRRRSRSWKRTWRRPCACCRGWSASSVTRCARWIARRPAS